MNEANIQIDFLWSVLHDYRETGALNNDDWDNIAYAMAVISETVDAAEIATDDQRAFGPYYKTSADRE